jgi:hypothetical protein
VLGTVIFAVFANWTVNGRSVLPLIPAVAVFLGRAVLRQSMARRFWSGPVVCSLILAMLVALGDQSLANSSRLAARQIMHHAPTNRTTWFQGHWGFHYYMQESGALPFDIERLYFRPGDLIVQPQNNNSLSELPEEYFSLGARLRQPLHVPVTIQSAQRGAGFYSSLWGPLPYIVGPPPVEEYDLYQVRPGPDKN